MNALLSKLERLAQVANEEHAEAQNCFKRGVAHAERAGKALIKAKATVGHGGWGAWLANHFAGSERTAQIYMRLARLMPNLDDEIRIAVAEMSLRDAVKEVSQPRIIQVTEREDPVQIQNLRINGQECEPIRYVWRGPPPVRIMSSPASRFTKLHSVKSGRVGMAEVVALPIAVIASGMISHLSALVAQSRAYRPVEFASALASNSDITVAELQDVVTWLGGLADELGRLAATQIGLSDDAAPPDGG